MTKEPDLDQPHRLHSLSWLFITAKFLRGLILPAIFVLFASRNNPWARYELLGAFFLIPVLIGALVKQKIFSYRFGDDQLVVRDGLLTKKERHIPYERIHNIAQVQNLFHRLFGVASARVETAGGGEPEAVMHVLPLPAIDELRERTLGTPVKVAEQALDTDDEAHEDLVLKLPPSEIIKLGLVSRRGFILIAGGAGLLWQASWWDMDWIKIDWRNLLRGWGDFLPDRFLPLLDSTSLLSRTLLGLGAVLAVLALLLGTSVLWHLLKYYGFTLRWDRGDLRRDYGLLTRISSLIPVRRIQLISVHATLLHRYFRRTSLEIETAGSSESGSDLDQELAKSGVNVRGQYLAPILERKSTPGLLKQVLPEIDLDSVDWQPLSSRARRRLMKRAVLITGFISLVLAGGLLLASGPLATLNAFWIPVAVLPVSYLRAKSWLRYTAWGLTDHAIFFRSGWLDRAVSIVPLDKIQTVNLNASPWDRRRQMASVVVDTAGAGTFGHRINIPYLDLEVAKPLFQRLYTEASETEFAW